MNTAVQSAPLEAQVERRSLDVLWQEAEALKPKRIEVESPAMFALGRQIVHVWLKFEAAGTTLRIEGEAVDVRGAFEDAIAKAAKFGIRP